MVTLASACLTPNGPIHRVIPDVDLPDPAAVHISGNYAQLYATNTTFWGAKLWVPTYRYNLSTKATDGFVDALPENRLPSWVQPNVADNVKFVWAPTVRKVAGKYLMMFTASRRSGWACIGAAHSTSPSGPFTALSTQWCSTLGGMLDPQIFVDGDGSTWVYYSIQNPNTRNSQISSQRISYNGSSLSTVGNATAMLTVTQARSVCGLRHPVTSCTVNPGGTPAGHFVENPAFVRDPYNSYNLLVSVGNWRDNSYSTVEVPCTSPSGGCTANYGAPIQTSSAERNQLGGASLLRDDSPVGNYLFFHARVAGQTIRTTHVQGTSAIAGN